MASDPLSAEAPAPAARDERSSVSGSTGGRDAAETKSRLLDAAERLFAERGFSGTSMRAVTRTAGVSVSAANYHFGSKEALLRETLGRVIRPVNRARLERLGALEQGAGSAGLALHAVLDAFLRPAIELRDDSALGRTRYRQLAARLFSDPPDVVSGLKQEHFGPVVDRFVSALQRALPDRDPLQVEMAFEFTIGMMVHVIAGQMDVHSHRVGGGMLPPNEELLARMIRYAAAGLQDLPRVAHGSSAEPPGAPDPGASGRGTVR